MKNLAVNGNATCGYVNAKPHLGRSNATTIIALSISHPAGNSRQQQATAGNSRQQGSRTGS
jgi:hypothetical protein